MVLRIKDYKIEVSVGKCDKCWTLIYYQNFLGHPDFLLSFLVVSPFTNCAEPGTRRDLRLQEDLGGGSQGDPPKQNLDF